MRSLRDIMRTTCSMSRHIIFVHSQRGFTLKNRGFKNRDKPHIDCFLIIFFLTFVVSLSFLYNCSEKIVEIHIYLELEAAVCEVNRSSEVTRYNTYIHSMISQCMHVVSGINFSFNETRATFCNLERISRGVVLSSEQRIKRSR